MIGHIITLTDGSQATINGIELLTASLRTNNPILEKVKITIIYPSYLDRDKVDRINKTFSQEHPTRLYSNNVSNDKYYLKLLLRNYLISSEIPSDEDILYLDYDHICMRALNFPNIAKKEIYVSSEIKNIEISKNSESAITGIFQDMDYKHFNTSIIYGTSEDILEASKFWEEYYELLFDHTAIRSLEEIAFSASAQKANIELIPVGQTFQGNFSNKHLDCSILHYGSESILSNLLKYALSKMNGLDLNHLMNLIKKTEL